MLSNDQAQSLGSVLREVLRNSGLDKKIKQASIPDHWAVVVGKAASNATSIKSFENGTLVVKVSAPVWRTELLLRRDEIREKLNQLLGGDLVKEIVLR